MTKVECEGAEKMDGSWKNCENTSLAMYQTIPDIIMFGKARKIHHGGHRR